MQLSAHNTRAIAQDRRVHAAARPAAPRPVALAAAHMSPALQQQAPCLVPCSSQAPFRVSQRMRRSVAAAAGNVPSEVLDTVVVGAGISGLVTAQALQTKHGDKVQSFLVTEGRERVGGNITSLQGDGYIWEEGPNSFQPNDAMLQAAVSAGPSLLQKLSNSSSHLHMSRSMRAHVSSDVLGTLSVLSFFLSSVNARSKQHQCMCLSCKHGGRRACAHRPAITRVLSLHCYSQRAHATGLHAIALMFCSVRKSAPEPAWHAA
jgi:hypothetical protein